MRTFAIKRDKLNEYGIYDIDKSKDTPTETNRYFDEQDIFAVLNLSILNLKTVWQVLNLNKT